MEEVWKAVPEWEGCYEASSLGRIRSLDRQIIRQDGKPLLIKGSILKHRAPTKQVTFNDSKRTKLYQFKHVFAITFIGSIPDNHWVKLINPELGCVYKNLEFVPKLNDDNIKERERGCIEKDTSKNVKPMVVIHLRIPQQRRKLPINFGKEFVPVMNQR